MSLQSEIGAPKNRYAVKHHDGVNADIQKALENAFARSVKEAAPIAYRFKGADRIATAENIYKYLKNVIQYEKDPDGYQDIRLPKFFHHSRVGDCKSFTLNTLSIWANLYPSDKIYFFYAAYDGGKTPTHVYALIEPKNEPAIIIDGCWYFFNSEKDYTLGFKSKNMQIRELSGIGFIQPHSEAPGEYLNKIYRTLDARGKSEFRDLLQKKIAFEAVKDLREGNHINAIECLQKIEAIEGIGAHKKKHKKGGGKKFLHWFNAAALFVGRAAFLFFVTLNVNGLASKLQQLNKWGKLGGVLNTWYTLGGNQKKFIQIINKGAGKKKLFLSKKAKQKYEQRYGALSPNEVAYQKGVHGEISGPEVAAAAIAVIPVLAALIPKMINGFRDAGAKGQHEAAGMINEGHDLVNQMSNSGYAPNHSAIDAFLPSGQSAAYRGAYDPHAAGQKNKYGVVFDLKKFYTPISDDPAAPVDDTPPPAGSNTAIPGGSPDGTIQVTPPANPMDKFNQEMQTLGPLLSTVAQVGLTTAGTVMSQSKNPNVRKWGGALDGAESVLTAQALRKAGYPGDARYHEDLHGGGRLNVAGVLFWSGLAYVGYKAVKK